MCQACVKLGTQTRTALTNHCRKLDFYSGSFHKRVYKKFLKLLSVHACVCVCVTVLFTLGRCR